MNSTTSRANQVTQFAYVPMLAPHTDDCSLADPGALSVALTTEEEGVALLAAPISAGAASC
jgi:hypothetical protein